MNPAAKVESPAIRPGVLHVLHDRGGGVLTQVRDLADRTRARYRHVLLLAGSDGWYLEEDGQRQRVRVRFGNPISRLVRALNLDFCHVHHLLGDHDRLYRALWRTPVPWGFTLHDFLPMCPRAHAVPPGGRFCEVPLDAAVCQACVRQAPRLRVDPVRWRADYGRLLRRAGFLSCPSAFLLAHARRHFPELQWTLAPHGYRPPFPPQDPPEYPEPAERLQVAIVGALGYLKGGERIERLAEVSQARGLPLRFVVLGDTLHRGGPQSLYGDHLFVQGSYELARLPELMTRHAIDLVAFPALGPETYCLVLDEIRACGRPALVPGMGALAERIAEDGGGWILGDWASDEAWLERLCALQADRQAVRREAARASEIARQADSQRPPDVADLYPRLQQKPGSESNFS